MLEGRFEAKEVRPGVIYLFEKATGKYVKGVGFYCQDCSTVKDRFLTYNVVASVWEEAGMGTGMLCLACLKRRVKRVLTLTDFDFFPINAPIHENPEFLAAINAGCVPSDAK